MSFQLKDCPFCQASAAQGQYVLMNFDMCGADYKEGLSAYVYCRKCKAHGPLVTEAQSLRPGDVATDLWNAHKPSEKIQGLFSK